MSDIERIRVINIILDELSKYDMNTLTSIAIDLLEGCHLTTDNN